ncbi:intraflagellar transport protein 22 homolog [Lingula anatina]|uniref:Intraflagellar transport protein 22 homolog n=1 Tax=Lingula anatina TaxID=7574 RepID=A0A1S3H1D7_LINAN|nr:intraflagellar transport protein 22 homolog [Lingula anatina]|eukprot:XP_013379823.1 intraflagellar transport protein 22 homolog [Lingula anatina]
MFKSKVLVLGPCESGKSAIANYLADATENIGGEYRPTQGVRILEYEANNLTVGSKKVSAEVELWDVSGDKKFESCWPAIAKDANGIVFVYNPDQANHDKDLEMWYTHFVSVPGLRDTQCLLFAHKKGSSSGFLGQSGGTGPPQAFSKISVVNTNLDDDGENVRTEFEKFLSGLLNAMHDSRDKEELSIMNSK